MNHADFLRRLVYLHARSLAQNGGDGSLDVTQLQVLLLEARASLHPEVVMVLDDHASQHNQSGLAWAPTQSASLPEL